MIRQLQREGYLRRSLTQTRPLLTEKHKTDRLKWCLLHVTQSTDRQPVFAPMYDTVHVDEKWFYVKKIGQKVYLLTGQDGTPCEDAPVQFVQSKRHILKVMFLCAVARPRGNWDGKVGMWPVVEKYVTQRRSVNRDAGVEELRPISMTREVYRRMLLEDVIPAIKAKWEWVRDEGLGVPLVSPIWVQQDNAKPHVLPDDPEVLVAGCAGGWSILFRNQPAQSPDLNVLDCGFFNAIQSLQSVTVPRTAEDLISEVERAFASTTTTTLNKTFLSVQLIMQSIMRHNGGNAFGLSHIQKDKLLRAGELPDSLSCDPALYRATLAKVVPQRATTCAPPPSSDFDAFF
ncbi:hypothetical protein AM588_10000086 [Phytophthora nicotianae]|uniref:Transposase Tc1-like domain-containing protein n=1 Tax=Phytophthora nicotianae TaxID=4792 RepID=A0A0W8C4B7_PHYNI|nr:hypothetical protein AM588_10000086 [Phytophthora nicotianae]